MKTKNMAILLPVLLLFSCRNTPNQPALQEYTYVPVHIGDTHQLVTEADSSTTIDSIIGKTLRKDGREVFINVESYDQYFDTSYFFIQDGFVIYTALDSPYMEQKNCMEKPTQGYSWSSLSGDICRYSSIGIYKTFAGDFSETFLLERLSYVGQWVPFIRNYYGKNIGLIGAEFIDSTGAVTDRFLLSYAKINGKEYGHLFPLRKLSKSIIHSYRFLPLYWSGY